MRIEAFNLSFDVGGPGWNLISLENLLDLVRTNLLRIKGGLLCAALLQRSVVACPSQLDCCGCMIPLGMSKVKVLHRTGESA
jgi:hypothetical protein